MDQANRPRTRGLEATEAEEDAKLIRLALQDPSKYIKKGHKLRSDFGGRRGTRQDESDEEERLFYSQPPYDDDNEDVRPGMKRKRGGWRKGVLRKKPKALEAGPGTSAGAGDEEVRKPTMSARLNAIIKNDLKPKIVPYNKSTIEVKLVWYKIGDVLCTEKEGERYYAQVLGFHTDQFCQRYVSIKWLIPKYKIDLEDPLQPSLTINSFKGSVPEEEIIKIDCFEFVLRPPANYFAPENPHVVTRNNFYVYNQKVCSFDSPTFTLTSEGKRY